MEPFVNYLPGVPDVESPFFEKLFEQKNISETSMNLARALRQDGFAVLDFPDLDFDRKADKIINTLDGQFDWRGWRNGRVQNLRVQDEWKKLAEVKDFACNQQILDLLTTLYGRPAFPFQTLNFPVGTQQHFHSDSVHFSSCPERFMAGVWIALEDIDSDNGPLVYYPGSHALPVYTNEHIGQNPLWGMANPYTQYPMYEKAWEQIVEALDLKPLHFHAKKGQALIWAANLLHGGAAQKDLNRTRHSQVTHYYFQGCSYYTPLGSVPFLGHIQHREIIDIRTGAHVPNMINGERVPSIPVGVAAVQKPQLPKDFDAKAYLRANPDVAAAKLDAKQHWLQYGQKEGRPLR